MAETIYILLPVHNRRAITERFIHCLAAQTITNYHLVLLDDGSTDGTADMVRAQISNVTVIQGDGTWWWAGALQAGYTWLQQHSLQPSDTVVICNDDTEFDPDFLAIGVELLQQHPHALVLAECYHLHTGDLIDAGMHADWPKFQFRPASTVDPINCLSTNGLFLRWHDFQTIGGFRPHVLPHYASDYEFTMRALAKGLQLVTNPRLRLRWDQGATGYTDIPQSVSLPTYFRQCFSNKYVYNPIVWMWFIGLCCPWPWKLINWLRVWKRSLVNFMVFLRRKITHPLKASKPAKWLVRTYHKIKFRRYQTHAPAINIILGAGLTRYEGWFGTDQHFLDITSALSWQQFFTPASLDRLLAEHVFEHLSWADCRIALEHCYRYLKPGGLLRIAVPDGYRRDLRYVADVAPPHYGHQILFTVDTLIPLLTEIGFSVRPLEYFDRDEVLHTDGWDEADGPIQRSSRSDTQEYFRYGDVCYTSLIVDARKLAVESQSVDQSVTHAMR